MGQLRLKQMKSRFIALLFCSILFIGCSKIKIENYFIPKDFVGNVAIIYSDSKHNYEDVYNYFIPQDGILYTNYPFEKGNYIINFYQKNDLNKYDTLSEELPGRKLDTTKNRIYFCRVLTFRKGEGKETIVTTFYIGKVKSLELEKDRFLFERHLEKIIIGN